MSSDSPERILIAVATYNEIENLPKLVDEILASVPHAEILIIDDNSPDGTGKWCDDKAIGEPRLRCIHREGKLGLGSASIRAFRYAVDQQFDLVTTMDADFSHQPRFLPALLAAMETGHHPHVDVAIGSRYVAGGGIEGWPLFRRVMSRAVNMYARLFLSLPVKDCSGAFRCYRVEVLKRVDFDEIRSQGYSYLEEILWRLRREKATFFEVPIVFVDRQFGSTKINSREAFSALWIIFTLGLRNLVSGREQSD